MASQPLCHTEPGPFTRFGLEPAAFLWATGIEDPLIPQTRRRGKRMLDEYALIQHYRHWRSDLQLAAELGVRALRYGFRGTA